MAIRQIKIGTPGSESYIEENIGALSNNILMSDDNTETLDSRLSDINTAFTGTDGIVAGTQGMVPAPATTDANKFLKSDGTWGDPAGGVTSVNTKTGAVVLDADDVGAIDATEKGAANGVAELDSTGKVPSAQLPSFVDDVIEAANYAALPATGEAGKIYVTLDDNKTYRWGGSTYVEISESLALGETSTTAFRGDYGKAAYDHATDANKVSSASAEGLYKVGVTAEGHVSSVTPVAKADITGLGIPAQDTTYQPIDTSIQAVNSYQQGTLTDFSVVGSTLKITKGILPTLVTASTTVLTGITPVTS